MSSDFHQQLRKKMDDCVHSVYRMSRGFPREELYGVTSQIRRAVLLIVLNYVEGFARQKDKVMKNFYSISYDSLKETKYLLQFCIKENYITKEDYEVVVKLVDDIGAMLWPIMKEK